MLDKEAPSRHIAEHPQDVLGHILSWRRSGPVALGIISNIEGGSVRSVGSLIAVAADGRQAGYVSGGCIDEDVGLQARKAIELGGVVTLRYGAGSPFMDLPLPCGGAIEITIVPDPDEAVLRACYNDLLARRPTFLSLPGLEQGWHYAPKLRVRIAGRGSDALTLARLVKASGYDMVLQLRDGVDVEHASREGFEPVDALQSRSNLPSLEDDAWTAFVLMFHDADWETALLKQALEGDAFYIGAVGSRRTQERRQAQLRAAGVDADQISRVRGPVGLIASMRDASMLAISTLAEIIEVFRDSQSASLADTAVLLLAAGQSSRFAGGDKLLASLNGKRVIDYPAAALSNTQVHSRVAVVGPDQHERKAILETAGWQVLVNSDAASGQASSLKAGLRQISSTPEVMHVLVLLADMPFVPDEHLRKLRAAMAQGATAAMSFVAGEYVTPAIFSVSLLPEMLTLGGDLGAKKVLMKHQDIRAVAIAPHQASDIDTEEDLHRLRDEVPSPRATILQDDR
ncbi:MAG: NTP transferase domain-containing protein [Hyphomonadaceae bacterium]|nr:NTP transferase domain-containing protein [Hyphomonadaceae bacterium]